jgi:sugar phosphate isomerase/epimerase
VSDLSLSTMWGIGQFKTLADFFGAARDLGFDRFELNHAVNSAMLGNVHLNGHKISSVHEPCPADISVSVLKERNWLISAPDPENRQRGVAAVRRSIDLARELGAPLVIVHPGRVDIDTALEMNLHKLFKAGQSNTPEYDRAKERLMSARAAQADANLESVRRSLAELAEYAARQGVRLGLENRYYYHEIPLPDELDMLLDLGYEGVIGYWHDVGHAQTLEHLGFCAHQEWLERFAHHIVGTHLHDVVGIRDHLAAGLGQIDWDMVARYLPADALRTCEFQTFNSPQQVAAGAQWLVDKGCVGSVQMQMHGAAFLA